MRPKGSADLIADRRKRALKLLEEELTLNAVARRIGCAPISVMRWCDAYQKEGEESFVVRFSPGRPPRLTNRRKRRLVSFLLKGAVANGYRTDLWTTQRIADLIEKRFGVRYHRDHIGRLLASLGFSYQKPERRAIQRDDEAIEKWRQSDWPRIKKTLIGWVPTSSL